MPYRRARRVDGNHTVIIQELRQLGFVVFDTSSQGNGFPDAVVHHPARSGFIRFLEFKVKNGRLTDHEKVFLSEWSDYTLVTYKTEDVLEAFGMV